jgi:hypothetical protein
MGMFSSKKSSPPPPRTQPRRSGAPRGDHSQEYCGYCSKTTQHIGGRCTNCLPQVTDWR